MWKTPKPRKNSVEVEEGAPGDEQSEQSTAQMPEARPGCPLCGARLAAPRPGATGSFFLDSLVRAPESTFITTQRVLGGAWGGADAGLQECLAVKHWKMEGGEGPFLEKEYRSGPRGRAKSRGPA